MTKKRDRRSSDSPRWPPLTRKEKAALRRMNALRNELGLAFREAQQEAYEQYASLEEQEDDGEEDDTP